MRKPVPPNANIVGPDKSDPPYPATPTATGALPPPSERNSRHGSPNLAAADSQSTWRPESSERDGLTVSLRSRSGRQSMEGSHNAAEDIPESLRVGPSAYTPRSSNEMQRPTVASTNPYLQRQQTGLSDTSNGKKIVASAWGGFAEGPAVPSSAPPPPPVRKGKQLSLCLYQEELGSLTNPAFNPINLTI